MDYPARNPLCFYVPRLAGRTAKSIATTASSKAFVLLPPHALTRGLSFTSERLIASSKPLGLKPSRSSMFRTRINSPLASFPAISLFPPLSLLPRSRSESTHTNSTDLVNSEPAGWLANSGAVSTWMSSGAPSSGQGDTSDLGVDELDQDPGDGGGEEFSQFG